MGAAGNRQAVYRTSSHDRLINPDACYIATVFQGYPGRIGVVQSYLRREWPTLLMCPGSQELPWVTDFSAVALMSDIGHQSR